ncbi:hypothetical protein CDAR_369611 [Caerostris darwini]|uniref:Uncharacterized protein n=1 Tax=Caerostris darwini TaxID=1538125 RepID=A0AAV4V4H3_9ARAC|nr:hypothetical protein CDAR_369611 [Caerostris darwini]
MEITKCEYCNTYVTNFEVHNCVKFGGQHRPNFATIPQNSYANLAEDIDVRTAEQMYYATRRSPTNQMNISRQQSILSNVHQPIYCKETAATEMVSQHGVENPYGYNPETSDFLFPDMYPFQENVPNSTQLQLPSGESKVFINQNLQSFQPSNSSHPPNISLSIAEPICLPEFQETSDQSNATINTTAQPSQASSRMQSTEIFCTNEMSSNFSSANHNFGESDSSWTNRLSQYSETSVETPILAIQNSRCNPVNHIPQTDSIHQTESFPSFDPLICDIHSKNRSTYCNSLCRNRESNIFKIYETGNPYFTDHVSLPSTSQISVQNRDSHAAKLRAMKFNEGTNTSKNMQGTDFSHGIADSASYASSSIQIQQRNFGSAIINSSTEPHAWGYSSSVSYSSGTYNARNISTRTTAKESSVNCREHSQDKILSRNPSLFNLDTILKKTVYMQ